MGSTAGRDPADNASRAFTHALGTGLTAAAAVALAGAPLVLLRLPNGRAPDWTRGGHGPRPTVRTQPIAP